MVEFIELFWRGWDFLDDRLNASKVSFEYRTNVGLCNERDQVVWLLDCLVTEKYASMGIPSHLEDVS
jgi:hypothetical protein